MKHKALKHLGSVGHTACKTLEIVLRSGGQWLALSLRSKQALNSNLLLNWGLSGGSLHVVLHGFFSTAMQIKTSGYSKLPHRC